MIRPEPLDLTGVIATAIDTAAARGHPVTVGYIDDDNRPSLSIRGSAHVHSPEQLAVWARTRDSGLARAIEERPDVSVLYFASDDAVPKMLLSIHGRARLDPSASARVYAKMAESERARDPDAAGVAVIIDVDTVHGMRAEGPIVQAREAVR